MPKKRKSLSSSTTRRDAITIKTINDLLTVQDYTALRKLVVIRGVISHSLRSRVWPILLGIEIDFHDPVEYAHRHTTQHKDSRVVECDMARSLWQWTQGWTDEERDIKREALGRIINAVIANNSNIYYYQGLHDIAAVLLFVCDETMAFRILNKLVVCHLRDCTQPTLAAVVEVLRLIYPLLQQADTELYNYIMSFNEPALEVPYFALSWVMTWFSHEVESLDQCARLFDLFIASHPLMPLYVAVVAMQSNKETIMTSGKDGDLVYASLKGMKILQPGQPSVDELACQAALLYKQVPPEELATVAVIEHSTTVDAYLVEDTWAVPAEPIALQQRLERLRAKRRRAKLRQVWQRLVRFYQQNYKLIQLLAMGLLLLIVVMAMIPRTGESSPRRTSLDSILHTTQQPPPPLIQHDEL